MQRDVYPILSKDRMRDITVQWRRFQVGTAVDTTIVRAMIFDSWKRCREMKLSGETIKLCPIDEEA